MNEESVSSKQKVVSSKQKVEIGSRERRGYRDLVVWEKAFRLTVTIYRLTNAFPAEERYGLTTQMRRAASSIPANIAEGYRRKGKDFNRFLRTASGSAAELETYLLLATELDLGDHTLRAQSLRETAEILRMLYGLMAHLE